MHFVQQGWVQLGMDAERPGMHTHAERGHDQMPGSDSVGAGLLANAVGQNRECWLPKPVRQQAGSYSFASCLGWWDWFQPGERPVSHCVVEGVQTGLFPAEAGPTESTADTCGTGFSREAVALLLIRF